MTKQKLETTIHDCKPTVVWDDTLMSGDWTFITDKEQSQKYCVEKRWCNNLQMCLAIKEKLDRKHIQEATDMLFDLLKDNG